MIFLMVSFLLFYDLTALVLNHFIILKSSGLKQHESE